MAQKQIGWSQESNLLADIDKSLERLIQVASVSGGGGGGGGTGTVTSVAASVPSFLSVAGSPITTSGTLAISYSGTALPVANGGTGLTTLGTGVTTALGINVGSAGAFVTFNGAGGTPSSLTLTNATGLPVGSITGLGTGVGTWLATPSWTNFNSAITGTAPYYLTASGGTATAANTFTHNFENGLTRTGTFTATANNSYAENETGTLTARATASDVLIGKKLTRTLVASAATQQLIGLDLQNTFTPGAHAPTQMQLRAGPGRWLVGTSTPFTSPTTYQFQAESGVNFLLRLTNTSNATSHLFRPDSLFSVGLTGQIALSDAGGLTESVTGTTLRFSNGASVNNTDDARFLFLQSNDTSTAGTNHNIFRIAPSSTNAFAPTSGTTSLTAFAINTVINQTGTASGTIYGVDYNPTLNGLLGAHYGLLIRPTSALNGFGTATPTAVIDLSASTTSRASLRIRTGVAPTSPNDGDIWQDGTDIKIRIGGVTKTFTLT